MDAIARHWQNLIRAGQAWLADRDPVRRMAALRTLFRDTHRLVNETLAEPGSRVVPQVDELHRQLQQASTDWDRLSAEALQSHLTASHGPIEALTNAAAAGRRPDAAIVLPEFLDRPDRSWERLLWRASLGRPGWRLASLREKWALREFAAQALEREEELSRDAIVLALSCLTPTGDVREWEWHLLTPAGAAS